MATVSSAYKVFDYFLKYPPFDFFFLCTQERKKNRDSSQTDVYDLVFCYCRVRLQGFAILIGCNQNMARHLYPCPLSLHHHTHLNHYTGMSILSMNEEMRRLFFDILSRSFILFYIFPFMSAILYPLPRLLPSFLHYLYLLCWLADTPTDRGKKSPKNYIILKPSKNYFSSSSSHKN